MKKVDTYTLRQLRDYSSLFSRSSAIKWLNGEFECIDYKINRYDREWVNKKHPSYLCYLKRVYKILQEKYQNEYIYKNEFLTKWLIDELGEAKSKIYSEFRVGNSVADLAMFNGYSKVFEIKTDLDSNQRLDMQINDYRNLFNFLYVIIPESKLKIYIDTQPQVGIIIFTDNEDNQFHLYRKAVLNEHINIDTLMNILHTKEYLNIVMNYYDRLPKDLTSFNQFNICKKLIEKIPIRYLNQLFIRTLKERKKNNAISKHHKEFNQLSLALDISRKDKVIMIENLKTPIKI